jgi:hypothetical protein
MQVRRKSSRMHVSGFLSKAMEMKQAKEVTVVANRHNYGCGRLLGEATMRAESARMYTKTFAPRA